MKNYELVCLISPDLNNEQVQKIQEEIGSFLVESQGVILSQKIDPAARSLGLEIKGKEKAFLFSFLFTAPPSQINEVEKKIKEKKEIIRHVLLFKKRLKERRKKMRSEKMEKSSVQKVEFKDIDKKIEEILNQ